MIDTVLPLALLLLLCYSLNRYAQTHGSSHRLSELPVHRRPGSASRSAWTIERDGLALSLSTSGFNGLPAAFLDRRSDVVKRLLGKVYDTGSALGVLGGIGAIGTTIWALGQVWLAVWAEARSHAGDPGMSIGISKRAFEEALPAAQAGGLQPLVSTRSNDIAG